MSAHAHSHSAPTARVSALTAASLALVGLPVVGLAIGTPQAQAMVATQGTGKWKDEIDWISWKPTNSTVTGTKQVTDPANPSAKVTVTTYPINDGDQFQSTRQFAGGTLDTICTVSNVDVNKQYEVETYSGGTRTLKPSALRGAPQLYAGSALPKAYGGSVDALQSAQPGFNDENNPLGLENVTSTTHTEFDVSCSATLTVKDTNGQDVSSPFPLSGLVFAEAESPNEWSPQWTAADQALNPAKVAGTPTPDAVREYVSARPTGENADNRDWQILESLNRNSAQPATGMLAADGTLSLSGKGNNSGAAAVAFLNNDKQTLEMSGHFAVQGAGVGSIAIGTVAAQDVSDSPISYGYAGAQNKKPFVGGNFASASWTSIEGTDATANLTPETRLGSLVSYDATNVGLQTGMTANEDYEAATGSTELMYDDGIANFQDSTQVLKYAVGQDTVSYSQQVSCIGPGEIRGWIDFNGNGTYDESEASDQVACTAGTATLTWSNIAAADVKAGVTYVRVRMTTDPAYTNGAGLIPATGNTLTGEVEDYRINLLVARDAETIARLGETQTSADKSSTDGQDNGLSPEEMFPGLKAAYPDVTYSFGTDASGEPVLSKTVDAGTYTIDPATGLVTFISNVDYGLDKVGNYSAQPVLVVATSATLGGSVDALYTPTIIPNRPVVVDVIASGQLGQPISQVPAYDAAENIDAASAVFTAAGATDGGKTLVVPGEGTWTIDATGAVIFTPEPGFLGNPTPVSYQAKNTAGVLSKNVGTAYYSYPQPTSVSDDTVGVQGATQVSQPGTEFFPDLPASASPEYLLTDPATGQPVKSVTIPGEGTYTIGTDGAVTFVPEKNFVGNGTALTVVAQPTGTNADGSARAAITATYQAKVTPTEAVLADSTQAGQLGQPVSQTPALGELIDPSTVTFTDGTTTKVVPGEGTWTIDPLTGEFTFTPEAGFLANPTPVTYVAKDFNGVDITAAGSDTDSVVRDGLGTVAVTYPALTVSPDETTGPQGQVQTSQPGTLFFPDMPASAQPTYSLRDPFTQALTTTVTITGEGTYVIDPATGQVTFTPEESFSGTAKGVIVVATPTGVDRPSVQTTYTPTVLPVVVVPDSTRSGRRGEVVSQTPRYRADIDVTSVVFEDGSKTKVVPGEGTWTIDPNTGEFTFTPQDGFVGDPTPVTYEARNKQGDLSEAPGTVTVVYTGTVPAPADPGVAAGVDPAIVAGAAVAGAVVGGAVVAGAAAANNNQPEQSQGSSVPQLYPGLSSESGSAGTIAGSSPAAPATTGTSAADAPAAQPAKQATAPAAAAKQPRSLANTGVEYFQVALVLALALVAMGVLLVARARRRGAGE